VAAAPLEAAAVTVPRAGWPGKPESTADDHVARRHHLYNYNPNGGGSTVGGGGGRDATDGGEAGVKRRQDESAFWTFCGVGRGQFV